MINPALFIGLGSTGTDILEYLQLLVLEEYGVTSLPVFKYLGIETNESHMPKASIGRSDVKNEIEMIYPTISSTLEIKDKLLSNQRPYLEDWLDEAILDIPGNSFTLGASNIRQAGRLCLWENWAKVAEALNDAKAKVTNNANIRETIKILREHYERVGKKVSSSEDLVGVTPNIYVVGSLCGGTCSGMFVDIAYYLRHILGLWASNYANKLSTKIQAIFTILDEKLLSRSGLPDLEKWAANCWAGLLELDFYSHPWSLYDLKLPDGVRVRSNDTPFDYTYIVSCSGQGGTYWKADGRQPDLDGLNHMVAMVLFTEAVGDLYGRKEEIRTDFRGFTRAGVPNQNEHVPCLASCGISAIWYPKYRITLAVACEIAEKMLEKWQGAPDALDQISIQEEARQTWERILDENMAFLTKRPGGSIEGGIKEEFDKQKPKLLTMSMRRILEEIGIEGMVAGFKEGGECDEIVSSQLAAFKKNCMNALREAVIQRINRVQNLSDVDRFLEILDQQIDKTVTELPTRYPVITPLFLDELEAKARVDIWSILSLRGKEVSKEKRQRVFNDCQRYLTSILKHLRGFRARSTLFELREVLGVGVAPSAEAAITTRTLKQEIREMLIKLREAVDKLREEGEEAIKGIPRQEGVEIIANNEHNDVEEDVRVLKGRLTGADARRWKDLLIQMFTITEGDVSIKETLYEFLKHNKNKIASRITFPLQRWALEYAEGFNIASAIQRRMDRATMVLLARRALPYMGVSGDTVRLHRPPDFLCGNDEESMVNIKALQDTLADTSSQNRIAFGKIIRTPEMDHLLIFYTEQGLLYMDENITTAELFWSKYRDIVAKDPYELHTRKGGRVHFDVRMEKRRQEAIRLVRISKELFSKEDGSQSDIFEVTKEGFIFRYVDSIGIHAIWAVDRQGVDVITSDEQVYELFKSKVLKAIYDTGEAKMRDKINALIARLEEREGQEEARQTALYYKDVMVNYFSPKGG
ncbi:TPA: hypothetical protein DCX15_05550 [bacterium]|nr:hypothetical protein [bacterium]